MEVSHKLSHKLGTTITNEFSGKSEFTPDMVTVDLSCSKGGEFHVRREYYDVFGESVDDD